MKILIGLILFPLISVGQITYKGSVINKINFSKIPFATVALLKENIEVEADENGNFNLLSINSKPNDTLIISSVGYEIIKVSINKLPSNFIFYLDENQVLLTNVYLFGSKNLSIKTLNSFSNCGTAYVSIGEFEPELAQHFHSDTNYFLLSEVEICKYAMAIIDPDKNIFRLKFYAMDPVTRKPSFELVDSVVEVNTSTRRTIVNLEKYKIYISEKDFFVAIVRMKTPLITRTEKSKINGKKVKAPNYNPLIPFKSVYKQNLGNVLKFGKKTTEDNGLRYKLQAG